jgi:Peptidase family M23.
MKKISTLILLIGITKSVFAQYDEVKVEYTRDESGVEIKATNQSNSPKIVTLNLTVLENFSTYDGNPTTKTIMPNSTSSICKLRIVDKTRGTNFNYRYQYVSGTSDVRFDPIAIYLLPIKEGKKTRIGSVTSIENYIKKDTEEKIMGYTFETEQNDTIYAIRKGIVYGIEDGKEDYINEVYKSDQNKLSVYHKDGTIAQYIRIKKGSALVKNGEKVEAGQPLALAVNKMDNQALFLITFSYYDAKKSKEQNKPFEFTYFTPKFLTIEGKLTDLSIGETYTSTHPIDVITLEMSKREKKKFLEKRGIKE